MLKIVKSTKENATTYQVVDEACEDMPENRGQPTSTMLEAVNLWLSPNNDESSVAKFLAEVPTVEEEATPEPIVGKILHGNIINKIMGKDFMRPNTHHALVNWCMSVLGYDSTTDPSIHCVGYDVLDGAFISELNSRVQKIDDPMLLLKLIEVAKEGSRGCYRDKYNDSVAEAIQNACMGRLGDFMDSLPPSLWHKVHRHELWEQGAETELVSLSSPDGWAAISGFREPQHGGWQVRMKIGDKEHFSPQYVTGMGMKARHDGYAKDSHSGVQCQAFHLFNHDGSLWGYEVYLTSPKKTVGCEVTKDGRFSLFRKDVTLPPRSDIRQGDMLLHHIEVQAEDEISVATQHTPQEMRSVEVEKVEKYVLPQERISTDDGTLEHKHTGYDYMHPADRVHKEEPVFSIVKLTIRKKGEHKQEYENVLVLKDDTVVLKHPDHASVSLKVGYWQILPVEGETDYQPRQRGGD